MLLAFGWEAHLTSGSKAFLQGLFHGVSPEILMTAIHCAGLKSQPYFMKFSRISRRFVQTSTTIIRVRIPAQTQGNSHHKIQELSKLVQWYLLTVYI